MITRESEAAGRRGVLICGEIVGQKLARSTAELIGAGEKLSDDLGMPMALLIIGPAVREAAEEAVTFGVEKVYTVEDARFSLALPEYSTSVILSVCEQLNPSVILFGQTDWGRDTAPRLGARLHSSLCLDCVELAYDPDSKSLLQTKPVYGGNALAVWTSSLDMQNVVTLRPRASEPPRPDSSAKGEIIALKSRVNETKIKEELVETVRDEVNGVKLEDARVVVAGGGGIGGKEGFKMLDELAQALHAALGITRVPSDEGWMPKSLEIGQTGHVVSPDLYLAVGISGAPQHLAGCSSSKCIVAINKDPEAHIFQEADFGIVGDYREILPPLIGKIKSLLGS